jgi:hypothetical protein
MVLAPLREDGAFSVRLYVLTLSVAAQTLSQASRKGKGGSISPPGGPCFNRQRSLPLNPEERGEPVVMICIQRRVIPTLMIVFEFQFGNSSKSRQGHFIISAPKEP